MTDRKTTTEPKPTAVEGLGGLKTPTKVDTLTHVTPEVDKKFPLSDAQRRAGIH